MGQFWNLDADRTRKAARRIEDAGYGVIWIGEAFGREALSFAAILLAATSRIRVATGVANLWGRDALAMINAGRTLAEAFSDRFVLGLGISHGPLVGRRGHEYGRPMATTREYLDAIETAPYRGPAPTGGLPIVLGALGEQMLELAADRTHGAHPYKVVPDHSRRARQVMGRDALLAPEHAFALTSDREIARAAARNHLKIYLGLDNYVRSFRRQGFQDHDFADGGSDRLLDALVAWGQPDEVARRLQEHLDAGADHVAAHPLDADGLDDPIDQLERLAAELHG